MSSKQKSICLVLAILLPFFHLQAQYDPIKLGAKIGFNLSEIVIADKASNFEGLGATKNFHIGLLADFNLYKKWGFFY